MIKGMVKFRIMFVYGMDERIFDIEFLVEEISVFIEDEGLLYKFF